MINKFQLWTVLILVLLIACNKIDTNDNAQNIYRAEFINNFRLSDYFESLDYVFLEECTDGLFINADKILFFHNRWYIFDSELMTILCFQENGKFLFRIHSVGKGPGEYQLLSGIMIHKTNEELWAICKMSRKILVYDLDGRLLRETKADRIGTEYFQMNNSDILVYDEEGHYLSGDDSITGGVFLHNNTFKAKHQMLKLPSESVYYQLRNKNNFSLHNDSCFFLSPSDSLICFPPDLHPTVLGVFDFGAYHLPERLKSLPNRYENYSYIIESGKVIWKENLLVSSESIFLNLGFRNSMWYGIIDRKSSRFCMSQGFINDLGSGLFVFPTQKKSENELIGFISTDHLLAYEESISNLTEKEMKIGSTKSTLSFIKKGLESSGNILVIAKLKTLKQKSL